MSDKAGYLGVDLGGTNVRAALLDESGNLIIRKAVKLDVDKNPPVVLGIIIKILKEVIAEANSGNFQIKSLGIGVPGSVDGKTGIIVKAPNLGWERVNLTDSLTREYEFPVLLANDITMAVWGEYCFGAARGYQDVVFIALGTGVGGGFIVNGEMFSSKAESGVEVGHMIVEPEGHICGCGSHGCWETIVSGSYLKQAAIRELEHYPDSLITRMVNGQVDEILASTIYEAGKQGDLLARRLWNKFIYYLAYGINNIVVIFNPQVLILGGGVTAGLPRLLDELKPVLKNTVKIFDFDVEKLKTSELGEDAGLIGAAYYGRSFFKENV